MIQKSNTQVPDTNNFKLEIRHVITRFHPSLEREFFDHFFKNSLLFVRLSLALGFLLYAAFGILDTWIVPISKEYTWIIRFGIVCPITVLYFLFSFTPAFKKVMQVAMSLYTLIMGFGIVVMLAITQKSEAGYLFYYAGLMLVIMGSFTLFRLRFVYATITSIIIILGYESVLIFIQGVLRQPDQIPIFLNNNFFFISANIIGMLSSFLIEYLLRNDFLLRKKLWIEEEKERIKTLQELAETKQELVDVRSTLQVMEYETSSGLQSIANTIRNKHAVQREANIKMAQRMLHLKYAIGQLRQKVPKALTKSITVVLDSFEKNAVASIDGGKQSVTPAALEKALQKVKKQIVAAFERKHFGSIEAYLSESLKGCTQDVINNMDNIINYIHAILAYQRGQEIAIEDHVDAPLQKIFFNIQGSYTKELDKYKIGFAYDNRTEALVVLPVYDFILEEDIIRNLFLNAFRALVEDDPENLRTDKKIWIEVHEKRIRGAGEFYMICFRDNGPGVPNDRKKAIFEGYSTKIVMGKKAGSVEPGVGLRTVKRRVEEIGGKIEEGGNAGEGANFVITIPKRPAKPQPRVSLDALSKEEAPLLAPADEP
jgi:signal transduction histidine kinase